MAKEKFAALLASNLEEADLLCAADMLSALSPNTAAVAIKIPLRNLSQLLSWPACLNAMRVTEAADPNFSLEKFRTTMLVAALRPCSTVLYPTPATTERAQVSQRAPCQPSDAR